jgi:hypothetical protein
MIDTTIFNNFMYQPISALKLSLVFLPLQSVIYVMIFVL